MDTRRKISLDHDFKEFTALLNSEGVKYLLLGGYAVNYYGYHRFTADIDFWLATDDDNAGRISKALEKFGFAAETVRPERFTVPGKVHTIGRTPVRVNLLTGPSGVEFEECYARRITAILDGVQIDIISLADLRRNKLASGREKDLLDLKHLPERR